MPYKSSVFALPVELKEEIDNRHIIMEMDLKSENYHNRLAELSLLLIFCSIMLIAMFEIAPTEQMNATIEPLKVIR